ncbi:hypothetical protein BT96DRAFT_1003091 [Gymnopus androsaceus JB14]|uniref:Uncharacterized protein n=1 Tax=Gymnopus androsaceus JB14 TaxID=1447944 RepID=A0A6A4GWV3_9AGAR|nr:hypothetical protein BT96DRAFT_1003091 [Gymnopus androsaceus JB14]
MLSTLLEGLRELSKNKKLGMEYDHYEVLIVKEYGVKLMGWPDAVNFSSPYNLNASKVIKLYHAVHSKECRWKKLDGRELHAVKRDIDAPIKSGDLAIPERQCQGGKQRLAEDEDGKSERKRRWKSSSKSTRSSSKGKERDLDKRVYGKGKGNESEGWKERRKRVGKKVATESNVEVGSELEGPVQRREEMAEAGKGKQRPWPRLIHKPSGIQVVGRTILSVDEGEGNDDDGKGQDDDDDDDEDQLDDDDEEGEDELSDSINLSEIDHRDDYLDDNFDLLGAEGADEPDDESDDWL